MTVEHPKAHRCSATARTGKQCGQPAIPGGTVCRYHGGAAPQVISAAKKRLAEAELPAIQKLIDQLDARTVVTKYVEQGRQVLVEVDDNGTQHRAAALLAGINGHVAVRRTELTGPEGGPIKMYRVLDAEAV